MRTCLELSLRHEIPVAKVGSQLFFLQACDHPAKVIYRHRGSGIDPRYLPMEYFKTIFTRRLLIFDVNHLFKEP